MKNKVCVLAFSRTFTCLSLMLVVVDLFGGCSMYLLGCICVLCIVSCCICFRCVWVFYLLFSFVGGLLVTSSPYLSMWLLLYLCIKLVIVVGIAFVYCFNVKWYLVVSICAIIYDNIWYDSEKIGFETVHFFVWKLSRRTYKK